MLIEVERNGENNHKLRVFKDIIRDIRNFLKKKKEPVRVGTFSSNNYIKYEGNGDRKKVLSIKEYLDEIKPHL